MTVQRVCATATAIAGTVAATGTTATAAAATAAATAAIVHGTGADTMQMARSGAARVTARQTDRFRAGRIKHGDTLAADA